MPGSIASIPYVKYYCAKSLRDKQISFENDITGIG